LIRHNSSNSGEAVSFATFAESSRALRLKPCRALDKKARNRKVRKGFAKNAKEIGCGICETALAIPPRNSSCRRQRVESRRRVRAGTVRRKNQRFCVWPRVSLVMKKKNGLSITRWPDHPILCTPPNPSSAFAMRVDHAATSSSRSVRSRDWNLARIKIEYFPTPTFSPR
jgi:hypothetical protein